MAKHKEEEVCMAIPQLAAAAPGLDNNTEKNITFEPSTKIAEIEMIMTENIYDYSKKKVCR